MNKVESKKSRHIARKLLIAAVIFGVLWGAFILYVGYSIGHNGGIVPSY